MTKITIPGFICETKFSPTDKPTYQFFAIEMKTQYTCPVMPYTLEVELGDIDSTAAHVAAIDIQIAETHLKAIDEINLGMANFAKRTT